MNVYKADVALLAGDLTGKAIVPIIQRDGRHEADLFGVHRTARDEHELTQLERDIADVGYYSFVTTAEDAERLASDEVARDELLHRLMNERVQAWLGLATERLGDGSARRRTDHARTRRFGLRTGARIWRRRTTISRCLRRASSG